MQKLKRFIETSLQKRDDIIDQTTGSIKDHINNNRFLCSLKDIFHKSINKHYMDTCI